MRNKLLLLATLSLLGVLTHGFVPNHLYGLPPPPSNNWSPDADSNNVNGSQDDRTSDHSSDSNLHRYRNPRDPNDRLSTISPSDSAGSAHYYRIRRATNDAFPTVVENMMKISRVINGIALQQGITNGTVKPDVVIKELLDLSQLDFGNLEELRKVVESIQGLPEALSKEKDQAERIEKRFRMYDFMLELTQGLGDTIDLSNKTAYKTEIGKLKGKNVQLSVMTILVEKLTIMSDKMVALIDSKQLMDLTLARSAFKTFISSKEEVQSSVIDKIIASIQSPQLRENIFAPLDNVQKALEAFKANKEIALYVAADDSEPTEILKGYLEQLDSIHKESIKVLDPLQTLDKTLRSSRRPFSGDRQLDQTSGFPNGFVDVGLVLKDLIDPWVEGAVDGQSDALGKAMEDLKIIAEKTRHISGSLKLAAGFSSLMDGVLESVTDFSALPDTFEPLASNLLNVQFIVDLNNVSPPNAKAFDDLYSKIASLTNKLKAMDAVLHVTSTLRSKEYVEKFDAMEKLMTDGTDDEVTQRLTQLRNFEGAKDVNTLLLSLKPSLTVLVEPLSIDTELKDIESNFDQIDKFVKGPSHFLGLLSNLSKIEGMDQIKTALNALDRYRGYKSDFGNFGKLKDKLIEVNQELEELRKSFDLMKGAKNPDSKALTELSDVWKDSQSIGSATRVFRGIKLLSDWNEDVVNAAARKLIQDNLGKMPTEDQKNLKQLDTLDAELKKLKTGLTAISSNPVMSKTDSNLTSFSPVYTLASKMNGVKYYFKTMSDSVDRLAKSLNNDKDLLDVKSKLDKLDSMGLDFAKHHTAISGVKKSLEDLDLFFAAFNDKMTPVVATVPTRPPVSSAPGSSNVGPTAGMAMTTEATNFFTSPLFLGCAFGALFIAVLILAGCLLYRKYKDNEDEYQKPVPQIIFDYFVNEVYFKYNYFGAKYNADLSQAGYFKVYYQYLFDLDSSQTKQPNVSPSVLEMSKYTKRQAPLSKTNRLTLKSAKATEMFGSNFIHGNMIFDDKKKRARIALLQAPQLADKATDAKETVAMFYWAATEQKCELMVCLTPTGPGELCAQYFPAETGGVLKFENGLVVTCEKVEEIRGGGAMLRTLTVKFNGKSKFTLKHIQHETWTGDNLPTNWKPLVEIMQMVIKEKNPVFIHCTDGLKQSAVMALAIMNKELLIKQDGDLVMGTGLNNLRHIRSDAITTDMDYLNAAMLSFELVLADQERENFNPTLEKKVKTIEDNIDAITGGRVNVTIDPTLVAAMKVKETVVRNAVGKKEEEENKEEKKSGEQPSDKTKKKKAPSSMSKVSEQKEEKSLDQTQEAGAGANTGPLAEEIKQHHFTAEKMEELIQADFDRFKAHANMMKKKVDEKKLKILEKKSLNAIDDTEV